MEITWRSLSLGLLLSVVMGAANVYLGLKAGMTVSASIPAAVIAMVLLRGFSRKSTLLESNQVQTAASAGESLAAGIIFTMPALILIGVWQEFNYFLTTAIALAGGLLGTLFMIPMRQVFIVSNQDNLKFPEGVACAEVLKAGEKLQGNSKIEALSIVYGATLGALFKFFISFMGVLKGTLEGAFWAGGRVFYLGGDVSPALLAVGLIVGLNIAILIFIGGALAWLIEIPFISSQLDGTQDALEASWMLWSTKVRYTGVGAMIVGGISSIYGVRHGIGHAFHQLRKATFGLHKEQEQITEKDLSSRVIVIMSLLSITLIAIVYYLLMDDIMITAATTIIMVVMSFFFTAVASYIVGLVGSSNSPVSGMTITAILFTGLLLLIFGFSGTKGMVATLGVAAIVCCVACTAGDTSNDLKTGRMVGAAPYRQQIMQILGIVVAAFIMAPVLQLLHDYTPGGIGGKELAAPQAALFASIAKGFFGDGTIPWNYVYVGVVLGLIILVIDWRLKRTGSEFRAHLMPIAVGMYLPFGLATPIFIGGLLAHVLARGLKGEAKDRKLKRGILFSSGAIAGESLMGVGIALAASIGINRLNLSVNDNVATTLTLIAVVLAIYLTKKFSTAKE